MPNLSEPGRSEKQRDIRRLTIDKGFGKSCNSLSLADLALMLSSRPYPARIGDGAPVGLARQAGASLFRGVLLRTLLRGVFADADDPAEVHLDLR